MLNSYNVYSLFHAFIPIIIICFFLLDSMINKNMRGIVFLFGMAFSLITSTIIYNLFNFTSTGKENDICAPFTINSINYFSKLPVNLSILIYTATNLSYTALVNGFLLQNIAFIFIILMLIITDSVFITANYCFTPFQVCVAMLTSFLVGILWSYVLHNSNNKYLIYNVGFDNNMVCEIPKKKSYKCKSKS
jgi:hypothetical protein